VLKRTPFLNGFSAKLFGRAKRRTQDILAAQRAQLCEGDTLDILQQLREEIDPMLVHKHSATQRVRNYPHELTFWTFLSQILEEDGSCACAVARVQVWAQECNLSVPSAGTSSYCAARSALPVEMLKAINDSVFGKLENNLPSQNLWRGHRVKAEDRTSAQAPDSEKNRAAFPYASGQAEGCGLPVVALGALIDLGHGGLEALHTSSIQSSELRGHDELEGHLESGDILVADRLYSSYEVISRLQQKGVHFIGRSHQARKMDFRKGRKIGPNERVQTYTKPRQQSKGSGLDKEQWDALPQTMELRIIRCYGPDRQGKKRVRYIVSTLLDADRYPADEVSSLYLHRWDIELRFRDIKTTLGMEMLRTKSPEMLAKEILMHMIVYNLIRLLMLKAAVEHGVSHRKLSFKGVLQVVNECRVEFKRLANRPRIRAARINNLRSRIVERTIQDRPGRNEPRRVKRRPKCSDWLQKPRHSYFEHFTSDITPLKILDTCA